MGGIERLGDGGMITVDRTALGALVEEVGLGSGLCGDVVRGEVAGLLRLACVIDRGFVRSVWVTNRQRVRMLVEDECFDVQVREYWEEVSEKAVE